MSYIQPMGDEVIVADSNGGGILDTVVDLFKRASSVAQAAKPAVAAAIQIVEDPYLPETACEIVRLSNIEAGDPPGGPCKRTDPALASLKRGVGLRHAVGPLRAYIKVREDPWIGVAVATAVVGGIFYLGYHFGRS